MRSLSRAAAAAGAVRVARALTVARPCAAVLCCAVLCCGGYGIASLQVYFDEKTNAVVGMSNLNYLLEKSRVCLVAQNERNFHIFYQMVKGLKDEKTRADLFLEKDCEAYSYLNQSVCRDLEGVDDSAEYEAVEAAFKAMEFPEQTIMEILKITAAVLQIGNISTILAIHPPPATRRVAVLLNPRPLPSYCAVLSAEFTPKEANDRNSEAALTGQDAVLSRAAALLDVKAEDLAHKMLHKKMVTTVARKEVVIEKKCKLDEYTAHSTTPPVSNAPSAVLIIPLCSALCVVVCAVLRRVATRSPNSCIRNCSIG
jgi:hypothetical protein